jgi:hypothetical protein
MWRLLLAIRRAFWRTVRVLLVPFAAIGGLTTGALPITAGIMIAKRYENGNEGDRRYHFSTGCLDAEQKAGQCARNHTGLPRRDIEEFGSVQE